jgi:integrase
MGHANTDMINKTCGRYIPNLTRQDGSALEEVLTKAANERQPE